MHSDDCISPFYNSHSRKNETFSIKITLNQNHLAADIDYHGG